MKGWLSAGGRDERLLCFQEFMLATNVSESEEAAEEKLRWAFRLYDKASSGNSPLDILPLIQIDLQEL